MPGAPPLDIGAIFRGVIDKDLSDALRTDLIARTTREVLQAEGVSGDPRGKRGGRDGAGGRGTTDDAAAAGQQPKGKRQNKPTGRKGDKPSTDKPADEAAEKPAEAAPTSAQAETREAASSRPTGSVAEPPTFAPGSI
eukprot:1483214-Pleurochrysis_carterae.AAC.1